MYASSFVYHRATSVDDARRLLAANPGAMVLAGGHSLLPLMKLRLAAPEALIDIGAIQELKGISADGGGYRLGAATTHAAIARSDEIRRGCAVLAETAARIGDPAVRNRGTIGGSIAHADPGADLPTVLVVIGAEIEVVGNAGIRRIPAADFFLGLMSTALGDGDLVTAVRVPKLRPAQGAAYAKFPHPASRYAVIGAAACLTREAGRCVDAAVAVGGLVPRPTRLRAVERTLAGSRLDDQAIDSASRAVAPELGSDLIGDLFASADYRRDVAGAYVAEALREAARRAAQ